MDERIERLREALEPFSREAENYDFGDGSGEDALGSPDKSSLNEINDLTVGDLRRARAASTAPSAGEVAGIGVIIERAEALASERGGDLGNLSHEELCGFLAQIEEAWDRASLPTTPSEGDGAGDVEAARRYATRLAEALHARHYPHVTQWLPAPDLLGLLTQIDNMTASLRPPVDVDWKGLEEGLAAMPPVDVEGLAGDLRNTAAFLERNASEGVTDVRRLAAAEIILVADRLAAHPEKRDG